MVDAVIFHFLNAATVAGILFIVAVGFSIMFGLMDVLNLAHASMFMLAGFIAYSLQEQGLAFLLVALASIVAVGALSSFYEWALLRRVYQREHLEQILLTLGVVYVMGDMVFGIWGGRERALRPPSWLEGSISVMGAPFPAYRLGVLLGSVAVGVTIYWTVENTRWGAKIRAAVEDRQMAEAVGVHSGRLFHVVVVFASALAAMAGVIAGPIVGVALGVDLDILILALIIVTIGGIGTIKGVAAGALLLGLAEGVGKVVFPAYATFAVYAVLVVVLLIRPHGLFPTKTGFRV